MNNTSPTKSLLSVLALAGALAAQGPQTLVGATRLNPALRELSTGCQAVAQCPLPGMPGANNPFAGGAAWDPVTSGAWITNGNLIAKYGPDCAVLCPPTPVPQLGGANTYVTGLEVVDGSDQLWMVDNQGRIRFYTNTCPPLPMGGCNTVLPPTTVPFVQVTTGLAIDEGLGLVFVAYANVTTGQTRIAVNDLSNVCTQLDTFVLPTCFASFGAVTGLACDWGARTLYATDGVAVLALRYAWNGSNLGILGLSCCPGGVALDQMTGLAVRPGRATTVGDPCANGSCANCPMVHRLVNDPVLGNQDFRLRLDGAFGNAFAFCLIGTGPCKAPSVITPPLCGPVRTVPFLGYLGPNLIQGPGICGGATTFSLPLPLDPSLVGDVYSSQCLNVCVGPNGALGFSLSNCLSWELQGV